MRIESVNIPALEIDADGLNDINMNHLGDIVIITGRNGAGKTRILHKIQKYFNMKLNEKQNAKIVQSIKNDEFASGPLKDKLKYTTEDSSNSGELKNIREILRLKNSNIQNSQDKIRYDSFIKAEAQDGISSNFNFSNVIYRFVPNNLNMQDSNQLNMHDLYQHASTLINLGMNHTAGSTFPKIQVVQNRWFNATHPSMRPDPKDQAEAIADYEKLKNSINTFLNTELERDINGDATIFGMPLARACLSDGQKVLLQFCLAIYTQGDMMNEIIIFMDEPENHLHPHGLIEVIDRIRDNLKNGQVWIATHSVPLIAHYSTSSIWYVENGGISYAGKEKKSVLNSLLGPDEEIEKLNDFIRQPTYFSNVQFTMECLLSPEVVMTGSSDPQTNQIRQIIDETRTKSEKVRLLDYGAGKGRLAAALYDNNELHDIAVDDWLEYVAFDSFEIFKDECLSNINKIHENTSGKYFNDITSLKELSITQNHSTWL